MKTPNYDGDAIMLSAYKNPYPGKILMMSWEELNVMWETLFKNAGLSISELADFKRNPDTPYFIDISGMYGDKYKCLYKKLK